MEAICRHILPQDDRDAAHTIPILPQIDKRLFEDTHDGYRFEDMPPDREAYRLGLQAIEEIAQHLHGNSFTALSHREQEELLESLHDGDPAAGARNLEANARGAFLDAAGAGLRRCVLFASVGLGRNRVSEGRPIRAVTCASKGARLSHGRSEEQRYEWEAPAESVSDKFTPLAGKEEHRGGPQGGTH